MADCSHTNKKKTITHTHTEKKHKYQHWESKLVQINISVLIIEFVVRYETRLRGKLICCK